MDDRLAPVRPPAPPGGARPRTLDPTTCQALIAAMLDPVVTADGRGTILHANPACERAFGYPPDELQGRNVRCLMPEPYHSEHDGYLERFRRTGRTGILGRPRELPVLRRDGDITWFEISIAEIGMLDGSEPIYCASFRDRSEARAARAALEESEARFRAVFEQESEFVCVLDGNGRLTEANPAALTDLGGTPEHWLGRRFEELPWFAGTTDARREVGAALVRATEGARERMTVVDGLLLDGHRHLDVQMCSWPDADGRVTTVLAEVRDVSDLVRVRERERALARTFAEIGESASLLAHEIRAPLTSLNLALRAVSTHLGQDERAVLEDLSGRLARLERQTTRTLSLARPLELRPETCDPSELLRAAHGAVAPELERARARTEVDLAPDTPPLWGDRDALLEVLVNLLRNALQATGEGGRVRLSAAPSEDGLRMAVEDDGPGVPPERRDEVFKPFVTSRADGSGLGLPIARKIAEAHGGHLTLSGSDLGGACFVVELPRAHATLPPGDPRPPHPDGSHPDGSDPD